MAVQYLPVEVVIEVYERTQGTGSAMIDLDHRKRILSQLLLADETALMAEEARQLWCLVTELSLVCVKRKLR